MKSLEEVLDEIEEVSLAGKSKKKKKRTDPSLPIIDFPRPTFEFVGYKLLGSNFKCTICGGESKAQFEGFFEKRVELKTVTKGITYTKVSNPSVNVEKEAHEEVVITSEGTCLDCARKKFLTEKAGKKHGTTEEA